MARPKYRVRLEIEKNPYWPPPRDAVVTMTWGFDVPGGMHNDVATVTATVEDVQPYDDTEYVG